ncbi:MAG: NAD(P)-binding domain-containing protein [bacterium]
MQIGILGTGDVGQSLGSAFISLGHEVMLGSRESGNPKAVAWATATGSLKAAVGTFAETAAFGEQLVLATHGMATEEAIQRAGITPFYGKLLIDTTNPLDFSTGAPALAISGADSLGERVQRLLPDTRVVKAFNTVGNRHMFRPLFADGPPDMFICGDDQDAKQLVTELLHEFGWVTVDIGMIDGSRFLEAMCLVWVRYGLLTNTWDHAFKLLRQ